VRPDPPWPLLLVKIYQVLETAGRKSHRGTRFKSPEPMAVALSSGTDRLIPLRRGPSASRDHVRPIDKAALFYEQEAPPGDRSF
jgi:hypothetical protein